ncbi:hypothetical protein GCM10009789_37280 [Kribbella sancticallisti]|uniref:Uncharacterized protein n=1 Tax=Kribbella sancticallisti TaxID=460087 RepID=A0ABN2DMG2_9ACTN
MTSGDEPLDRVEGFDALDPRSGACFLFGRVSATGALARNEPEQEGCLQRHWAGDQPTHAWAMNASSNGV